MGRQRIADPLLDLYSKFPDDVNLLNPYSFAGVTSTPAITGETVSTTGNAFNGYIGFVFTVGAANITVTDVGRYCHSGNSETHRVDIRDSGGTVVGSANVNLSGASSGAYKYAALASPIVLTSGSTYACLSDDQVDDIYGISTPVTFVGDINTVKDATASGATGAASAGGSNNSHGPTNFKYHL